MVQVITAYWCVCEREACKHRWLSSEIPKRCAKCKGRAWNKAEGKTVGEVVLPSLRFQGGPASSGQVAGDSAERVVVLDE